jgi:diaminohydroxyphosphoribosylaminopyrimidine deaminase/5-amino-6-(5-phosphoribosylamino)uracil reductase
VTLKLATSLDGRIATASGESKWITGPEARRHVHALRLRHDAVLVGGGTARADDPSLTVREMGAARQPVRVVASAGIDVPTDGNLARTARQVPLWLVHGPGAPAGIWQDLGAEPIGAEMADGQIDPASMLAALAQRGLTRVLCEGGSALAASLLRADLIDDIVMYRAGVVLGADARAAVGDLGGPALADLRRFRLTDLAATGGDSVETWTRP